MMNASSDEKSLTTCVKKKRIKNKLSAKIFVTSAEACRFGFWGKWRRRGAEGRRGFTAKKEEEAG
jgi:hypothetical protein